MAKTADTPAMQLWRGAFAGRHQGATMACQTGFMSETESIRRALYPDEAPSKRQRRAARTRAQALAPGRIIKSLLSLPVLALGVAMSVYIRTSPYEPPAALAHLIARVGCDAARSVGLAPAFRGALGYHARNDADNDGVACESADFRVRLPQDSVQAQQETQLPVLAQPQGASVRMAGGAKFIRP